jgi:hypothetical protein
VRFFGAALCGASRWRSLLREALCLCGLGVLFGLVARRLLA